MKDKPNIDHIRLLLHKYYEAETTPEEETLLETFFQATPADQLPEDLAEDGTLFNSLAPLHPGIPNLVIPEDLPDRMSEATDTPPDHPSGKIQRLWHQCISYVAAAACACLLIYIGNQRSHSDHNTKRSAMMTEEVPSGNVLDDGFIEITDPEEAEKIMTEIGLLLAANTRQTNEAIQHLEKTVDEYKELTKSILK